MWKGVGLQKDFQYRSMDVDMYFWNKTINLNSAYSDGFNKNWHMPQACIN